ncbi:MAG TPA: tRNA preQ1(34) S-adenosylmethionine ribosyltransferase-isomerase QueA [Pseudomonadales bacterium]
MRSDQPNSPHSGAPDVDRQWTRADFGYDLPAELIAQQPTPERDASRLLILDRAGPMPACAHGAFCDLPGLLRRGDLLVVNDTRVVKARLLAEKDSGGRAEILLERAVSEREALCQVRASKPLKAGRLLRAGHGDIEVLGREGEFYRLRFPRPVLEFLEDHGEVPLPPYIERSTHGEDELRYQTVWSSVPGAVAAPTAGLHFTERLLAEIDARGVRRASLTLHVGAGTFQPVRVSRLTEHRMHRERYVIPTETAQAISETAAAGGRIVAVGTTVVRTLESAATGPHQVRPGPGETALFITPGFRFNVVDALVTNFHLPESTLLMLIAAFGGYARVMAAYREAVDRQYRFFSYGDAMFLERQAFDAERRGDVS